MNATLAYSKGDLIFCVNNHGAHSSVKKKKQERKKKLCQDPLASDKKPVIINLACISRHYYFFPPACNTLLSRRVQTSPSSASAIGRFHLLAGSHPCQARCCVNKWLELIKGRVVYRVCLQSLSTECVYRVCLLSASFTQLPRRLSSWMCNFWPLAPGNERTYFSVAGFQD